MDSLGGVFRVIPSTPRGVGMSGTIPDVIVAESGISSVLLDLMYRFPQSLFGNLHYGFFFFKCI